MNRFQNGQRVVVTEPDHPLVGQSGTVVRLRMSDSGVGKDGL